MKTNKSFTKRIRVTKTGKLIARKSGQNHFNAKENSQAKSAKRKNASITMSNKAKSRFLPGA
ncbi:MAG: 50S ribosomal protein L35 [Patescibacteria group bacterium UBA2163]